MFPSEFIEDTDTFRARYCISSGTLKVEVLHVEPLVSLWAIMLAMQLRIDEENITSLRLLRLY